MANITGYLAKTVGIAGLGAVGYDGHKAGVRESSKFAKDEKVDSLQSHYYSSMKSDSDSVIKAEAKKQIFNCHLDEGLTDFFANIIGYCKGFAQMSVSNAIPLALSTGAVLSKNMVSKTFGLGLVAYGGIFLLQEAFGIGKNDG